jgi:hypothetical protein
VRALGELARPRPVTHSMYRRPLTRSSATCDMLKDVLGSTTKRSTSPSGTERDRTRPAMRTRSGPIVTNPRCARTKIRVDITPTGKHTTAQKIRAPIGPLTSTAATINPQLSAAQAAARSVMPARNLAGAVHLRSTSEGPGSRWGSGAPWRCARRTRSRGRRLSFASRGDCAPRRWPGGREPREPRRRSGSWCRGSP